MANRKFPSPYWQKNDEQSKKTIENTNIIEDIDIEITTIASDFSKASKHEIYEYYKRKVDVLNHYYNYSAQKKEGSSDLVNHLNELRKKYGV